MRKTVSPGGVLLRTVRWEVGRERIGRITVAMWFIRFRLLQMRGKGFVAAAIAALLAVSCSEPEAGCTLDSMNLRGRVKRVAVSSYEAVGRGGEIREGDPVDDASVNGIYHFGEDGLLRRVESYSEGDLIGWRDYSYDEDNRLQRIACHSVLFNGDSTVEAAWEGGGKYTLRTYDEQGVQISENRSSLKGNRLLQTIITPYDALTVTTRYRKRRPVREERESPGGTVTTKYEYDGKGNEARIVKRRNGEAISCIIIKYEVYDGEGNWLRRVLYDVDESGAETPSVIQRRTIVYY